MINKYILVLIILFFLTTGVFTMAKTNEGIVQMKEAASKLSDKMTRDEVVQLIGEPTFKNGFGDVYWFEGGERLILKYGTWLSARNKDGFNLLRSEYNVTVSNFPVVIDGEKLLTSNPVLNVDRGKIYLSVQDFEKAFGLKVSWDKENQQLEAATKNNYGEYEAKIVYFPVLIDGNELITSNPIVAFDGNIYFSIQELAEKLRIKIDWNNDKKQTEIITNSYGFHNEYAAIVTDVPIYVDGNKLLTFNPIVTINGNIYFPIEDWFGIRVDCDEEKQQLKITTNVEGFIVLKNHEDIARFKDDIGKLHYGMTRKEVRQILFDYSDPNVNYKGMSSMPPIYYIHHNSGIILTSPYSDQGYSLSALFNEDGFDLLATGYVAKLVDFPVFIDGKELLTISNPIVTIHNKVYVPLDNLAEQLGITVTFNEEKQQLEIITK